jgi:hypothetical protein
MPFFATQRQGNGVIPMLAWPDAQEVWDMCIAKTLRTEGAAINLQTGTPVTACIWSHFRENTLSVGFSFRSLENATKRHEIARKLEALFSSALEEKCGRDHRGAGDADIDDEPSPGMGVSPWAQSACVAACVVAVARARTRLEAICTKSRNAAQWPCSCRIYHPGSHARLRGWLDCAGPARDATSHG